MSIQTWTFIFVGLSFSLYLCIAWRSRVSDTQGFYVADRGIPAAANGMATAADWMSAASFGALALVPKALAPWACFSISP
jgi:cation/acetate symporter